MRLSFAEFCVQNGIKHSEKKFVYCIEVKNKCHLTSFCKTVRYPQVHCSGKQIRHMSMSVPVLLRPIHRVLGRVLSD